MELNSENKDLQTTFEVSTIAAVAIKLPSFWPNQPKIWFAQAESQFVLRGISSEDTRYHHVIAALDQDTAKRVVDIIDDSNMENKYRVLKERLLKTFTLSPYRMAQKLLNMAPLGDRTPSELMDDMLALVDGSHGACTLFRTIFVDLLPADVRSHLLPIMEKSSPRDLALLADQLIVASDHSSISTIRKKNVESKSDSSSTPRDWCRLHRKWGAKAYRCEQPCSFGRSRPHHVNMVQGNCEAGHQ